MREAARSPLQQTLTARPPSDRTAPARGAAFAVNAAAANPAPAPKRARLLILVSPLGFTVTSRSVTGGARFVVGLEETLLCDP